MPVTNYTHNEPVGRNGKPVFIIRVPNQYYTGRRKGVLFFEGVGRTESPARAKYFAEVLRYEVTPPADCPVKFEFAHLDPVAHEDAMDELLVPEDPFDEEEFE